MNTEKPTRKRRRKAGDIATLRRVLWASILASEQLLIDNDPDRRLRAVHALTQASATYARLTETSDLENRIVALEQALGTDDASNPRRLRAVR
jgi:hypothetical protein